MYSKGFGKIAGSIMNGAAMQGSTVAILITKEFLMPVSIPSGVKALVSTV